MVQRNADNHDRRTFILGLPCLLDILNIVKDFNGKTQPRGTNAQTFHDEIALTKKRLHDLVLRRNTDEQGLQKAIIIDSLQSWYNGEHKAEKDLNKDATNLERMCAKFSKVEEVTAEDGLSTPIGAPKKLSSQASKNAVHTVKFRVTPDKLKEALSILHAAAQAILRDIDRRFANTDLSNHLLAIFTPALQHEKTSELPIKSLQEVAARFKEEYAGLTSIISHSTVLPLISKVEVGNN